VAADLMEHVIKERHPRLDLAAAATIEPELHPHIGFSGDAMHFTCAHGLLAPEALTQSEQSDHAGLTCH
jgi:hypothetical protein